MLKVEQKVLNKAGMRITSQRALILDIIRQGQGHLDADDIYIKARKKVPKISLSTVYRTLQVLKKLNLVEELHFADTQHHYEIKPATEHHHLICLGCGKVIEFQHSISTYIETNVPEAKDFNITETEVRLVGYCAECTKKCE